MSQESPSVLTKYFIIHTLLLMLFVMYEQSVYMNTGRADTGAMLIIEIGATAITWYIWFYLIPKYSLKAFKKIIAFVRGQHEPEAK